MRETIQLDLEEYIQRVKLESKRLEILERGENVKSKL